MLEYAGLVASPRALPDGLILVFQHPDKGDLGGVRGEVARPAEWIVRDAANE